MKTLDEARKTNKLTQGELAQLLKVSQVTVSNWERGTCLPNSEYRERIEAILKEQIHWNSDSPLDEQEKQAVINMLLDISRRSSHREAMGFIINKSRNELRTLIRSLGYLVDPMLLGRDGDLENSLIRRK